MAARGGVRPLTEDEKDKIFALHSEGYSCAAIARELKRAKSTISTAARTMGLKFDRHLVMEATEAHVKDARAKRAELANALLDDAERLRQRVHAPYKVWRILNDGELATGTLDLPDARDQRDLMAAVNTAVGASLRLEEFDADPGINGAKSMLGALAAGLGEAYNQLNPPVPDDGA